MHCTADIVLRYLHLYFTCECDDHFLSRSVTTTLLSVLGELQESRWGPGCSSDILPSEVQNVSRESLIESAVNATIRVED